MPMSAPSLSLTESHRPLRAGGGLLLALLVAATFCLGIAPTLTWLEFANGSENLNVETVLEMHRGGPWLVPTLLGGPRTIKPPLTAWLTALAVSRQTVQAAGSPDSVVREQAMRELAWQVRWPALLSASLMLLATYALGRTLVGDGRLGVLAAAVCGSSLLFLRYTRAATTDVQLALWVTVTSALLAAAVLEGRWWLGCVGGGLAAGLAFMSKGPVGWVQSILPVAVFLVIARRRVGGRGGEPAGRVPLGAVLAGVLAMLAVALPWPALVAWSYPGQWSAWWTEVTRIGAREAATDPWYDYVQLVPLMMPWTLWLIAGVVLAIRDIRQGASAAPSPSGALHATALRLHPMALALLLTFLPVVVMSFFRDKPARYLLPMAAPAAILVARGLLEHGRTWRNPDRMGRWLVRVHWLALAALAVGLPLAGALWRRQEPWYPMGMAVAAASAGVVVLLAGMLWHRRRSVALVVVSFVLMLGTQTLFSYGYARSDGGRNELKPLADEILARYPGSSVYSYHCGVKSRRDLSIYLSRVVIGVDDVAAVPSPGGGLQVLVVGSSSRRREGSATTLPSQWVRFAELSNDSDRWEAYVREPRPAAR